MKLEVDTLENNNGEIVALWVADHRYNMEDVCFEPRPSGEWVKRFDGNEWFWYCTSCKEQWYEEDLYMGGNEFPNFCPNCGASMKKEGE